MIPLEIVYYPSLDDGPVKRSLSGLIREKPKAYLRLAMDLETLGFEGLSSSRLTIRALGAGLWELKRPFDGIAYRILFGLDGRRLWLVDFYEKESRKLPLHIRDRALKRLRQVVIR